MRTENRKEKEKPTVSNQGFSFVVNSYIYRTCLFREKVQF